MEKIDQFHSVFFGSVTVQFPSGEHRTFKIQQQAKGSKFCPGKTIVSLMNGPDNEFDYQGFAFRNDETGQVNLWSRYKDSINYRLYALVLSKMDVESPDGELTIGNVTIRFMCERRCAICHRKLTTPESIGRGIGPICIEKAAI